MYLYKGLFTTGQGWGSRGIAVFFVPFSYFPFLFFFLLVLSFLFLFQDHCIRHGSWVLGELALGDHIVLNASLWS